MENTITIPSGLGVFCNTNTRMVRTKLRDMSRQFQSNYPK